jgi:uncharacterized protein involved in exopolysaccharide biosynthesis
VVLCAVAGTIAMLAALVVQGPRYIVGAKILVRLGPEIATSPLLAAREPVQGGMGAQRPEDSASVVEILNNPRLIRATVESLGEEFFADQPPQTLMQHVKAAFKSVMGAVRDAMRHVTVLTGLRPPTTRMDRIILAIGEGLRIEPVRRTDVIQVVFGFPDPRAGEAILERYIDLALADHVEAHRMPGAREFFAAGVAEHRAELRRVETMLLAARTQGNPVWAADEQRALLLRAQADLQLQYHQAVSAAAESEAEVAMAEAALALLPAEIELSSVRARNQAIDELRVRLVQLRMDQVAQRARYGDASPEAAELGRQIDTLAASLAAEPEYRVSEVTEGVNLVQQGLARDLTGKRILREGQRVRVAQLAGERERLARELERLASSAIEIGRLEHEVARLRRAVDLYEKGLDDARIAEAMETVQLSGLRVVMPPTAEIVPSQPSLRRGLVLGLAAGVVLSFGLIAVLEYRRHTASAPDADGPDAVGDGAAGGDGAPSPAPRVDA